MKKRVAAFFNFIVFNLLFFALYLNFIHKDISHVVDIPAKQMEPIIESRPAAQAPTLFTEKENAIGTTKQISSSQKKIKS